MEINRDLLKKASQQFGTPTYVYDASVLKDCYFNLRDILPSCVDVFYALKVNPNLSLVKMLSSYGANTEVCSLAELEISLKAGVDPQNIIFLGPCKKEYELKRALEVGIYSLVIESETELKRVSKMAGDMGIKADIAIRINPNFSASGSPWKMGGRPTHFGIEENHAIENFGQYLQLPHLNIRGIHVYNGTKILQAQSVFENCEYILSLHETIADRYDAKFSMVDVGGGLGIPYFDNETALDTVELKSLLFPLFNAFNARHPGTRIIMESGRFIVGQPGTFLVTVDNIKENHGKTFVVTDGGTNCHSSAIGSGQVIKRNFPIENLNKRLHAEKHEYHLSGPLCNPDDLLGRNVSIDTIYEGDVLAVLASGAYGATASPVLFHSHGYPAEVIASAGQLFLARPRDTTTAIVDQYAAIDVNQLLEIHIEDFQVTAEKPSEEIIEEVISSLRKALNISSDVSVSEDAHLRDDLGLDSLSSMELLTYLEDQIPGFYVNPDTIEASHFNTVETLTEYIRSSIALLKVAS